MSATYIGLRGKLASGNLWRLPGPGVTFSAMKRAWRAALALLIATFATPLFAATDQERAAAREAAGAGLAAFGEGDFEKALEFLERAESIVHAPTHWLYIARARAQLGMLVEAREAYQRVINEALPENASEAFTASQALARRELEEVNASVAKLTVVARAEEGSLEELKVTIDGAPLSEALLGLAVPANPGERVVRAEAAGRLPLEMTVTLAETEERELVLILETDPNAVVPVEPAQATPFEDPAGDAPAPSNHSVEIADSGSDVAVDGTRRTAGWISLGAGAALVGAGAVVGILSWRQRDRARNDESLCPDFKCSSEGLEKIEAAHTKAVIADISMGTGIFAAAVGTYLIFTSPATSASSEGPELADVGAPTLTPMLGADGGGLSLVGNF